MFTRFLEHCFPLPGTQPTSTVGYDVTSWPPTTYMNECMGRTQ